MTCLISGLVIILLNSGIIDDQIRISKAVINWSKALDANVVNSRLMLICIDMLNPVIEDEFTFLTTELIDKKTLKDSRDYISDYFRLEANPFHYPSDKVKMYYHFDQAGIHSSSLLYKWSSDRYSYTIMEKSRCMMLRVNRLDSSYDFNKGISSEQMNLLIRDVLSQQCCSSDKPATELFKVKPISKPNDTYSNFEHEKYDFFPETDWRKTIICFVTKHDVCFLFFKYHINSQVRSPGIPDKDWLPSHMYRIEQKKVLVAPKVGKYSNLQTPKD